jgi:hypothetical protein
VHASPVVPLKPARHRQSLIDWLPVVSVNVPAGQAVQVETLPPALPYVLSGHGVHVVGPQRVPAAHCVHGRQYG